MQELSNNITGVHSHCTVYIISYIYEDIIRKNGAPCAPILLNLDFPRPRGTEDHVKIEIRINRTRGNALREVCKENKVRKRQEIAVKVIREKILRSFQMGLINRLTSNL